MVWVKATNSEVPMHRWKVDSIIPTNLMSQDIITRTLYASPFPVLTSKFPSEQNSIAFAIICFSLNTSSAPQAS